MESGKDTRSGGDDANVTQTPHQTPVSIFGILVVGLLSGLVVGLIVNSSLTLQGFLLGFAGGALVTVGLYFYATSRNGGPK